MSEVAGVISMIEGMGPSQTKVVRLSFCIRPVNIKRGDSAYTDSTTNVLSVHGHAIYASTLNILMLYAIFIMGNE